MAKITKYTRKLQRLECAIVQEFSRDASADGCIDFSRAEVIDLALRMGFTQEEGEAVATNLGRVDRGS